jgi:hypothetical protein
VSILLERLRGLETGSRNQRCDTFTLSNGCGHGMLEPIATHLAASQLIASATGRPSTIYRVEVSIEPDNGRHETDRDCLWQA